MERKVPLISIILPVYNGESYLERAIDSILAQTYLNWELLIIDDGSTDGSTAICDKYAEKDTRIKAFHQENCGVNAARAKGIDNALGVYLTFLDADDHFTPDALARMTLRFEDTPDVVSCGSEEKILDRDSYIKALWSATIAPGICGKMFKTVLFKKIPYRLERRMAMGEDLLLNSIYALSIDKAVIISSNVYAVNTCNEASVTKTFKHNWEYEKYYFSKVEELFLSKCAELDSYDQIKLLVNKSWLNAMKYVMLDGGTIDYNDPEYKAVRDYFKDKKQELGPSEELIFRIKNSRLYRFVLKVYVYLLNKMKR